MKTSVLLADDHTLLTDILADFLRNDFLVVGVAQNGEMMVKLSKQHEPDVVIADIHMPRLNGIDAARIIRKEVPSTKVLFLTMDDEATLVEEAFRAGAAGFVLKSTDVEDLLKAIRTVAQGERYVMPLLARDLISMVVTPGQRFGETRLTPRQRHILQLIAQGRTMKEAATAMDISLRTAETHKYQMMRRLGVGTTAELIRHAIRLKLV